MIMDIWQTIQNNPDLAVSILRESTSTLLLLIVLYLLSKIVPIIREAVGAWRESQIHNASSEARSDEIMLKFVEASAKSQARITDVVEALGGKITSVETLVTRTDETTARIDENQKKQFKYIQKALTAIYRSIKETGRTNKGSSDQVLKLLETTLSRLDSLIIEQKNDKAA